MLVQRVLTAKHTLGSDWLQNDLRRGRREPGEQTGSTLVTLKPGDRTGSESHQSFPFIPVYMKIIHNRNVKYLSGLIPVRLD